MQVKTLHTLFVGQTDGQTGGRRARSTIHTILIARYVEIPTAVQETSCHPRNCVQARIYTAI